MSVATQISRLTALRDRIRTKLVSLGLASSSDKLAALTDEIESITAQGAATITPSESFQTAVAAGKYTTGNVTVGAISSTYVGTGIARRTSSNLTASGATVTAPAGYYASAASKSVASGSARTVATTISANPTISISNTGLITATASASKSITPSVTAGYISSGTAGTITVSGSNTQQLPTMVGQTVSLTSEIETIVASNVYTLGDIIVDASSIFPDGDNMSYGYPHSPSNIVGTGSAGYMII